MENFVIVLLALAIVITLEKSLKIKPSSVIAAAALTQVIIAKSPTLLDVCHWWPAHVALLLIWEFR